MRINQNRTPMQLRSAGRSFKRTKLEENHLKPTQMHPQIAIALTQKQQKKYPCSSH